MGTKIGQKEAILHAKEISPGSNPEKLVAFIEHYLEGMPPKEAWVAAGYSENTASAAMNKIRENWKLVAKMVDFRIGMQVPLALNVVKDLMMNSKSDTVRLNAAKDILSRAGKDKPIEINHSAKSPEEMKDEDLDAEIISLAEKINLKSGPAVNPRVSDDSE